MTFHWECDHRNSDFSDSLRFLEKPVPGQWPEVRVRFTGGKEGWKFLWKSPISWGNHWEMSIFLGIGICH